MTFTTCTVFPFQGFHFTLQVRIPTTIEVTKSSDCLQYLLYSLPRDVFVDPYELTQRLHDNIGPQFKLWGEHDLELPTSAVSEGSLVLLGPVLSEKPVDLPFHARYPLPALNDTHVTIELKKPSLLTICDSDSKLAAFNMPYQFSFFSCFSAESRSINIHKHEDMFHPYDYPFDSKIITGVDSCRSDDVLSLKVPAGNQNHLTFVEPLTMLSIFVAACYMGRYFWKTAFRFGQNHKPKME